MPTLRQHILIASTRIRALVGELEQLNKLIDSGDDNSRYEAVRNAIIQAERVAHDLTPLRYRLSRKLDKATKKSGKAATA